MTGPQKSSFSVKDLEDVGETPELVIVQEPRKEKLKSLTELNFGSKINSVNEVVYSNSMHHKDGGDRSSDQLQKLEKEKPASLNHQSQKVVPSMQPDDGNLPPQGSCKESSSYFEQFWARTRSRSQNSCGRRLSTCSIVKTDLCLKKRSLSNGIITTKDDLQPSNRNISIENTRESSSPNWPTCSLKRPANRNCVSFGKQAGTSHRKAIRPSRVDQISSDELELCSFCKKKFPNLSKVPGSNLMFCSACRRKSKTLDPAAPLDSDFQTPPAKSAQKKLSKAATYKGCYGENTSMEIDSSDEDHEATIVTGAAFNPCNQQYESGLRSTVTRIGGCKVAYPSRADPEAVEILASDIQRLNPLEFLNDTIIDFYIKYIQMEFLNLEGSQRFHFFSSFFYKKLKGLISKEKKKGTADFSKLRKWTKGINIFEKDYLFIPVHDKLHWSLAIICFPNYDPGEGSQRERCILHLDSMACGHDSKPVFRLLRRYLIAEWKHRIGATDKKGDDCFETSKTMTCEDIPSVKVPVPLQENESDCGLFLLHYVQRFVGSAPTTMKKSDLENSLADIGVFGRQWFLPIEASSLRTSIQEQLQRLFAQEVTTQGISSSCIPETHEQSLPRNLEAEF